MAQQDTPQRVQLEDFTESTVRAIARAMDTRDRKFPWGPILFGVIWWPDENGPVFSGPGRPGQPSTPDQ